MNLRLAFPAAGLSIVATCVLAAMPASSHRHSSSSSSWGDGPATDCSGLRIRFDHQDAIVQSEEHTLSRAEAPLLRVEAKANGGVQFQGWDKDSYSVTACKAVSPSVSDPQGLLSQIHVSVQGGEVSASGPRDHDDWTIHLLIRAPKSGSIELHGVNGPVSLYDVDGKFTSHVTNGPVSIYGFSGDADITAVNGPISFKGTGGNLKIHTENGPITISLTGSDWIGSGIVADAENGPVTLRVPPGFHSSFVVESSGNSPVTCDASVCDQARRTWDDEHRRIEYGSAPAVVRLSTVNGPVAVRSWKESF